MFVQAGQNGPLFFLALRPWFWLTGTSEFAVRYPSAMAGTVSVALLWQVAGRLAPTRYAERRAGEYSARIRTATNRGEPHRRRPTSVVRGSDGSAAFLAANPYQLWYGQEGKMYTVVTALVLLASWFFWRGITAGGSRGYGWAIRSP